MSDIETIIAIIIAILFMTAWTCRVPIGKKIAKILKFDY